MRRFVQLVLLVLMAAAPLLSAQTIDRIVATVNSQPILASDVDEEIAFEALQQAKGPESLEGERRQVLDRIIERELVRQQMSGAFAPQPDSVSQRVKEIRTLNHTTSDAEWNALLVRYGLDGGELRSMVTEQLEVVHFLDMRLRPTVRVDNDEISDYYDNSLLPKLKSTGATVEPLDSVRQKIQELLLQQKMTAVFDAWIANLRNQARISILDPQYVTPDASAKGQRTIQ